MNSPVPVYQFTPAIPGTFSELDEVRLLAAVTTCGGCGVPAGSEGTVLSVWGDGAAYEVEFEQGFATVEAELVAAADRCRLGPASSRTTSSRAIS